MTMRCRSWLAQAILAVWGVLAVCPWCEGATGSTKVFTTGKYRAEEYAPDYLSTYDPPKTLKVTGGIAAPVRPFDQGKVAIDWNLTSGATAAFVMRSLGWGSGPAHTNCLYR